jgi:hypothetical protein
VLLLRPAERFLPQNLLFCHIGANLGQRKFSAELSTALLCGRFFMISISFLVYSTPVTSPAFFPDSAPRPFLPTQAYQGFLRHFVPHHTGFLSSSLIGQKLTFVHPLPYLRLSLFCTTIGRMPWTLTVNCREHTPLKPTATIFFLHKNNWLDEIAFSAFRKNCHIGANLGQLKFKTPMLTPLFTQNRGV